MAPVSVATTPFRSWLPPDFIVVSFRLFRFLGRYMQASYASQGEALKVVGHASEYRPV